MNYSINEHFRSLGKVQKPEFRLSGKTRSDWKTWRTRLLPRVKASLLASPAKPKAETLVQAEWEADGLIKQKLMLRVERDLWAPGYLFRPKTTAKKRLPAILCNHGHGPFGKDPVMGIGDDPAVAKNIEQFNYDYGLQMAKAGFVTMAIDWRGFGERDDRRKPHYNDIFFGRDPCDVHYVRETILGRTLLGMNVHDGMIAIDHLCRQPFVDPSNIGTMGLSFGGTMTTWLSICDDRIKAANIICYSNLFKDFGLSDANFCGSQITPGLFALCDVPDLQGLIAPRPLLVEIGTNDTCFLVDSSLACHREVEKIYRAAGASDQLELDLFEGGHQWGGRKSVAFFRKHLV